LDSDTKREHIKGRYLIIGAIITAIFTLIGIWLKFHLEKNDASNKIEIFLPKNEINIEDNKGTININGSANPPNQTIEKKPKVIKDNSKSTKRNNCILIGKVVSKNNLPVYNARVNLGDIKVKTDSTGEFRISVTNDFIMGNQYKIYARKDKLVGKITKQLCNRSINYKITIK